MKKHINNHDDKLKEHLVVDWLIADQVFERAHVHVLQVVGDSRNRVESIPISLHFVVEMEKLTFQLHHVRHAFYQQLKTLPIIRQFRYICLQPFDWI